MKRRLGKTRLTLMGHDCLDVTEVGDADLLVQLLPDINKDITGRSGGFLWFFRIGPDDDAPCLMAGVRGKVGMLHWYAGWETLIPVDGLNQGYVDYWLMSGHEIPQDSGCELPVERVYEAVAELVRTHARPTCIEWRPVTADQS